MSITSSCSKRSTVGLDRAPGRRAARPSYSASVRRSSREARQVMVDRIAACMQRSVECSGGRGRGAHGLALARSACSRACGQKGPLRPRRSRAAAAASAAGDRRRRAARPRRRADAPARRTRRRLPRRRAASSKDVPLADLARRFGTPLYVYSQRRDAARAGRLPARAAPAATHLICYAVKANSTLAVLQMLRAAGCGFDIVSGGELERVLAAGGDPARDRLLRRRQDARRDARARSTPACCCFNVESEAELDVLDAGRRRSRAHARRSACASIPTSTPKTHPYISTGLKGNKFGIAHERRAGAPTGARPRCRASRWSASTATSARRSPTIAPYLDALDRVLDLVEAVEADGIALAPHRLRRRPGHHLHATRRRRRPTR